MHRTKSMISRTSIITMVLVCCLLLLTITTTTTNAQANTSTTPPATNATATGPQVRFIRDFVPLSCPLPIKANYLITFHYSAHHITKENRVGEIFDETADYQPAVLQVNARAMLPPLAQGLIGACLDERRTVIIPHQFATFEGVPETTDVVFMVHIIDVKADEDYFSLLDTDGSGCIDLAEMTAWVETTGRVQSNLYEITAKRLMRQNDANKDGLIECEELQTPNEKNCDIVTSCKAKRDSFDSFFDSFNDEHHITPDDLLY